MKDSNHYFHFPLSLLILIFLAALCGLLSTNPLLTITSILALPFFAVLLWRRREPPILFFVIAVQWLQVTLKVFHADFLGTTVEEMFGGPEINQAIWLSLAGLLVLTAGMRWAVIKLPSLEKAQEDAEVMQFHLKRLWIAYLVIFAITVLCKSLIWTVPGLTQVFLAFFNLRWVLFFILAYTVLYRRQKLFYLILATFFEIIVGSTEFFAAFKQALFILLIVFLTMGYRMTLKHMIKITAIILVIILLFMVWLSIRKEYRDYVNLGTGQQWVAVPFQSRLSKIVELSSKLDFASLKKGFELLLLRIEYVDLFAYVIRRVPDMIPYEGGALLGAIIKHVLYPRLFFLKKHILESDSVLAMKYTGLDLEEEGTSIGMGYMAESYIDFGPIGMLIPLFILGLLYGLIYRYFSTHSKVKIFGYAIIVSVLIAASQFETRSIKLLGGLLTAFIVMALSLKFVIPYFNNWLKR